MKMKVYFRGGKCIEQIEDSNARKVKNRRAPDENEKLEFTSSVAELVT